MAHEITTRSNGFSEAFFYKAPAWHGLGQVVQEAPTGMEALTLAGLDWTVSKQPVCTHEGVTIPTHKHIRRDDNGDILGIVGKDYGLVQNSEAFAILDGLKKDGVLRYESAFSIRGGRVVCLLARLDAEEQITDKDRVLPYVMLSTSHDGSAALYLYPTAVRVVCANTWKFSRMAAGVDKGQDKSNRNALAFKLRHTSGVKANAERAVNIIGDVLTHFSGDMEAARAMVSRKLSEFEFLKYLDAVYPLPTGDKATARGRSLAERLRNDVKSSYYRSPLNKVGDMDGTAWAAFNAVTEFIDHGKPARVKKTDGDTGAAEARFSRTMGPHATADKVKAAAWNAALELVS